MLVRMLNAIGRGFGKVLDKLLIIVPDDTPDDDLDETEGSAHQGGFAAAVPPASGFATPPAAVDDTQSLGGEGTIPVIRRGPLVVCVAKPRNIDEAASVGERLRDHMVVILNLEIEDKGMSQRIFDYMTGAAHVLNAKCERGGRQVYTYVPQDIQLEVIKFGQPRERLIEHDELPLPKAVGLP